MIHFTRNLLTADILGYRGLNIKETVRFIYNWWSWKEDKQSGWKHQGSAYVALKYFVWISPSGWHLENHTYSKLYIFTLNFHTKEEKSLPKFFWKGEGKTFSQHPTVLIYVTRGSPNNDSQLACPCQNESLATEWD